MKYDCFWDLVIFAFKYENIFSISFVLKIEPNGWSADRDFLACWVPGDWCRVCARTAPDAPVCPMSRTAAVLPRRATTSQYAIREWYTYTTLILNTSSELQIVIFISVLKSVTLNTVFHLSLFEGVSDI